ncbi:MAG: hypothetical protein WC476_01275 [Phycisphaerae bacterium]|jgi:hypothetical protein
MRYRYVVSDDFSIVYGTGFFVRTAVKDWARALLIFEDYIWRRNDRRRSYALIEEDKKFLETLNGAREQWGKSWWKHIEHHVEKEDSKMPKVAIWGAWDESYPYDVRLLSFPTSKKAIKALEDEWEGEFKARLKRKLPRFVKVSDCAFEGWPRNPCDDTNCRHEHWAFVWRLEVGYKEDFE